MHQNLQCQGVRNPLALRLKIGLTCFGGYVQLSPKPRLLRLVVCCLVCSCVLPVKPFHASPRSQLSSSCFFS